VFVSLDTQHAKRTSHIVICGLPRSKILFHIISQTARLPGKKRWTQNVSFDFLLSETFLILTRTERDMIKNTYRSSCKVPVVLVTCSWNFNFLDIFSKNTQISNFMKIRPVRAELFYVDGRTDKKKLIVAFRNFANAPKNELERTSKAVTIVPYKVLNSTCLQRGSIKPR
jgi:hypothetical protein